MQHLRHLTSVRVINQRIGNRNGNLRNLRDLREVKVSLLGLLCG